MQKIILGLFFIAIFNFVHAATVDLVVIKKWEKKYPTAEKLKNKDIFHVKSFKKALLEIISQ